MMASDHPNEIELFEEVEGELDPDRSREVRAHLETCATCSANVAELVRAREVLRSSPLFELPAERLREMATTLPKRERRHWFFPTRLTTLQRVSAAVAAVAAVVVAVTIVTTGNDNAGERTAAGEAAATAAREAPALEQMEAQADKATTAGAAAAAPTEAAPGEAAPPAEAAPAEPAPPSAGAAAPAPQPPAAPAPVASVEGTPEEVAKLLEQLGFSAEVLDATTVQVTDASADEVKKALEGRAPGQVNVLVQEQNP